MADPEIAATFPDPETLMPVRIVKAPHPSLSDDESLASECENRFQRRSGPGGQHRNKTSSGVFLKHRSSEIVAEATERRSQTDNRKVALLRLRFLMAIELRTPSIFNDETPDPIELQIREKYKKSPLKFRESHPDRSAVIALLLNDLHAAGGQPSLVAANWQVSTSAITRILKSHPESFAWVNACRAHHGKKPLR